MFFCLFFGGKERTFTWTKCRIWLCDGLCLEMSKLDCVCFLCCKLLLSQRRPELESSQQPSKAGPGSIFVGHVRSRVLRFQKRRRPSPLEGCKETGCGLGLARGPQFANPAEVQACQHPPSSREVGSVPLGGGTAGGTPRYLTSELQLLTTTLPPTLATTSHWFDLLPCSHFNF